MVQFFSLSLFGCRFDEKRISNSLSPLFFVETTACRRRRRRRKPFRARVVRERERERAQKKTRRVHGFETCLFLPLEKESRDKRER